MDITNPTHPLNPLNPMTDPYNIYGTHSTSTSTCTPTAQNDCRMEPWEVGLAVLFIVLLVAACAYIIHKGI